MRRIVAGAALALLCAAPAYGAHAARDLRYLNAERARVGLPAGIVENRDLSKACAHHNAYQRRNGGTLTHDETPGNPGYTPGGDEIAGKSVLAYGQIWVPQGSPWQNAPIQLNQLYTPSLKQIGIDDGGGYVCATTWPGFTRRFATERVTTYPGDGVKGIPPSENAIDSPFVPGDFVGIPQGTTAGRELFVYLNEPGYSGPVGVKIHTASLSGPSGPVEVRWVDTYSDQIKKYLTGGIVIPVKPLAPGTQYRASVTIDGAHGKLVRTWRFTTAPVASVRKVRARRGVSFQVACGTELACRGVSTLRSHGHAIGRRRFSVAAGGRKTVRVKLNKRGQRMLARSKKVRGRLRVTVTAGTSHVVKKRRVTLRRDA